MEKLDDPTNTNDQTTEGQDPAADQLNNQTPATELTSEQQAPPETTNQSKSGSKGWKQRLTKKNILIIVIVGLLGIVALTDLKYMIAGVFVKGSAEVKVADSKTLQPVPGATVTISNVSAKTSDKGVATIKGVKIGRKNISVSKIGYQSVSSTQTLGFGTTKTQPILLKGKGITVAFLVKDKISGEALEGVTIKVAANQAKTNAKGQALLNVLPRGGVPAKAAASKPGYADTAIEFQVNDSAKPKEISMVPAATVYFISNKSGKYDLYSSDMNGNQKIALAATGKEDARTTVLPSGSGKYVALVSARDGQRDPAGSLLLGLYVIESATGQYSKVDTASEFQDVQWNGDTLLALKNSAASGEFQNSLTIYNADTKQKNAITGVGAYASVGGYVYYALPDKNKPEFGFYSSKLDGSEKKKLSEATVYAVYRSSPNTLVYANADDNSWKSINTDTRQIQNLAGQPSDLSSSTYESSPDKTKLAYTQDRDGANRLLTKNVASNEEKQISSKGNVLNFGWISNNHLVYLVQDSDGGSVYVGAANGKGSIKLSSAYIQRQYGPYGR